MRGGAVRTFMFWMLLSCCGDWTPVLLDTGKSVCSFWTVIWPKYLQPSRLGSPWYALVM